jgi:hypothetical protein
MTITPKPLAIHKAMSTLVRPKFGPGMLLEHGDLELLPAYTRELNRMMFRSLFGCGVVCGLRVQAGEHCGKLRITIACGLAIDCEGDPVYVPQTQIVDVDVECERNVEGPLFVVLCGTTKCCAPRASMCAADDDEGPPACTRERDAFEIRVLEEATGCGCLKQPPTDNAHRSECKCVDPEHPCYVAHYAGFCGCHDGDDGCGCECHCECIVLARIARSTADRTKAWTADHSVRRFVRPVLMRDPVEEEAQVKTSQDHATSARTMSQQAMLKKGTRARGAIAKAAPPTS